VGAGTARPRSVVGLLGSGSGLGGSALIPAGDGWVSLGSEGGHTSFSPRDERELAVLRHAWTQFEHVSFERLLSGPGLELIYRALAERAGRSATHAEAPAATEITRRAQQGLDPLASETLDVFCNMLGTTAANLAVTLGATGGIYIGGAIVPRLGELFDQSGFRARFESKGRFSRYVSAIPTFVITAPEATARTGSATMAAAMRRVASLMWAWSALAWSTEFSTFSAAAAVLLAM
jgi:glucokinase